MLAAQVWRGVDDSMRAKNNLFISQERLLITIKSKSRHDRVSGDTDTNYICVELHFNISGFGTLKICVSFTRFPLLHVFTVLELHFTVLKGILHLRCMV